MEQVSGKSKITMSSFLTFSTVSLGIVGLIARAGLSARCPDGVAPVGNDLDWIREEPVLETRAEQDSSSDIEISLSNRLTRGLASLGLLATSPRRAPAVKGSEDENHPATQNDDIADEVVHMKRVSPQEEEERYFAAFSQYQ